MYPLLHKLHVRASLQSVQYAIQGVQNRVTLFT